MSFMLCFIISILWIVMMYSKSLHFLHIIQLEGYSSKKFSKWINENKRKIYNSNDIYFFIISLTLSFIFTLFIKTNNIDIIILFLIALLFFITNIKLALKKVSAKKPFVYTKRAKRLIAITFTLINLDFLFTILLLQILTKNILFYFPLCTLVLSIIYILNIYYVSSANYLSVPIENKINMKYYNMAIKKIRSMDNILTVGITGSYGKTSTKYIASTILAEKFRVKITPESYNTPMGISKIINNELNDDYEVFIAELGATKTGDIEEIAKLTNPKIGILTSIGPCHLESFGSIENIMKTKYELIEFLPQDGIAIFNYDNNYVRELADKTKKNKIIYAIDYLDNIDNIDVYAKDIHVNDKGSMFKLCIRNLGCIDCQTMLLGKHNILNILAGASVAKAIGMNLEEIKDGIAKIAPVEHRLKLLDPKTGILVIDDAFNSNPDGASAALDVLNEFENRRKIIITPGMVELGEIEKQENKKFGEKISKVCDIVILVGKLRTQPIYDGLIQSGFSISNIYVVNSTNESTELIKKITKNGDIILYENDLPDTYE